MCSRYHLSQEYYRKVLAQLGIPAPAVFATRYNIAPSRGIPAIRAKPRVGANAREAVAREAVELRWGLTPGWARSDEPPSRLVNARAETLAEKPSFREALRSRRCVVPATGFYEWETIGRAKQPWYFRWREEERPVLFAGLWETWRAPDGSTVESCALITTEPNELMRPVHNRMPVMLAPAEVDLWLDPTATEVAAVAPVLHVPRAEEMSAMRVDDYVSNVQHEGPACLAPAKNPAAPQLSFGFE